MNRRKLTSAFKHIKEVAHMDYAITDADKYGDCMSCVNYALGEEFGVDSKGVWTKHYLRGMNKGEPWKMLDGVYICHDITEEQAKIFIAELEKLGYNVEPNVYDPYKCFYVSENNPTDEN